MPCRRRDKGNTHKSTALEMHKTQSLAHIVGINFSMIAPNVRIGCSTRARIFSGSRNGVRRHSVGSSLPSRESLYTAKQVSTRGTQRRIRRQTTPRLPFGASQRPRYHNHMLGGAWLCLPTVLRMKAPGANEASLMQGQITSTVQPIQGSGTNTWFEVDMNMFPMPNTQLVALSPPTCISTPCTS